MESPNIIILVLLAVTMSTMVAGIVLMAIGGEVNRKYGNRLMMMRVVSQGVLVLLLGAFFAVS